MRSRVQISNRPLCAALVAGGLVAALAMTLIAAPMLAANQPTYPGAHPAGQMYVASQPSDLQETGPGQPPQPAPGASVVPEPIFENEVEGVVKAGSINIATTGPGAQTFVLSTGNHGDVTIRFPGAPLGTALAPGEVGTVAQLQDGVRVTAEGRLASDAQTFEAARVELVPAPVTKDVTQGTLVSFANGKLTVLANGVQKTFTITGDTQFRPDDKSAADLVGLASGNRLTVVSERDMAKGVVIFPR